MSWRCAMSGLGGVLINFSIGCAVIALGYPLSWAFNRPGMCLLAFAPWFAIPAGAVATGWWHRRGVPGYSAAICACFALTLPPDGGPTAKALVTCFETAAMVAAVVCEFLAGGAREMVERNRLRSASDAESGSGGGDPVS